MRVHVHVRTPKSAEHAGCFWNGRVVSQLLLSALVSHLRTSPTRCFRFGPAWRQATFHPASLIESESKNSFLMEGTQAAHGTVLSAVVRPAVAEVGAYRSRSWAEVDSGSIAAGALGERGIITQFVFN